MSNPTATLAAQTEALRAAYAALNRNDIPAFVQAFAPDIEWTDPPGSPESKTYHGLAAFQAHASQARAAWAEGSCEPERFITAGDKVIVFVHVRVRLKHETEWREGSIADVYTFRDGKVIRARVFTDRQQALDWAGVKSPHAC